MRLSNSEVKEIIGTAFPASIICNCADHQVRLSLREKAIGCAPKENANMQEDEAAFETWALLLHKAGHQVMLDVQDEVLLKDVRSLPLGHYGRFLYRALRFSEGFSDWFSLSEALKQKTADLAEILKHEKTVNNAPSGGASEGNKLEARVENDMAKRGVTFLNGVSLYRQLPVGLFKETVASGGNVFTGGSSAIDLWGIEGETFHVIELKAGKNKKLGAISEMFFYANYAYDVFCGGGFGGGMFSLNRQMGKGGEARGYDKILGNNTSKVCAHVLVEKDMCHSSLKVALAELCGYQHEKVRFDRDAHTYDLSIMLIK